jgi:hypothetical protein
VEQVHLVGTLIVYSSTCKGKQQSELLWCSFGFLFEYIFVCFLYFCLILYFMYFYCYVYCHVYSVSYIVSIRRLPWLRFSVLFPQLCGKCHGISRKDGAQAALFLIHELCCFMYCFVSIMCCFYAWFVFVVLYLVLCVNVYCTTANGCQPNCS